MSKFLFWLVVTVIIVSPFIYYATGVGQNAADLSADPVLLTDGSLGNSPKSEALHQLALPMRIERYLIYPALLLLFQFSGFAVQTHAWLRRRLVIPLTETRALHAVDIRLRQLTRQRLSLTELLTTIFFISAVSVGIWLLYLPFSIYSGFILRHQFDISTQTFSAWLQDFWTNKWVSLLLTLLMYGGFYVIIKLVVRWPLWAGLGYAIFTLAYTLIYPVAVLPLFYTVTPVTDADLLARIDGLAMRAGVEIDDVVMIDASRKTTTVNAMFTGFGGASKIILWDTLLQQHPPAEVDAVLAHEMGHWHHKHVLLGTLVIIGGVWVAMFALHWLLNQVWQPLGWRGPTDSAGYPFLIGVVALVSVLTLPIYNGASRIGENQADDFALQVSGQPAVIAQMFQNLAGANLSRIHVPTWEKVVFYTHPPIGERIEKANRYLQDDS